jgi:hypothetical protein
VPDEASMKMLRLSRVKQNFNNSILQTKLNRTCRKHLFATA